jgi:Flp pilus assembly protein TadB
VIAPVAGLGVSFLIGGPVGWVAGLGAAAAVWRVLSSMEPAPVRRRRQALEAGLPHVVDLLACCLSAGASTSAAVALVARVVPPPPSEELYAIAHRLALGGEPALVWADVGRHPQWGQLGRSLARAIESGSSVSGALHRLAGDLRRDSRARVEARARGVGVRAAAPLGLCLLPAFILIGVVPLVAASMTSLLSTLE